MFVIICSNGTSLNIEVAEESNLKPTEMIESTVDAEPPLPPPAVEADEHVKVEGEPVVDAVIVDGGLKEIAVTKKEVGDETEEQIIQESEITAGKNGICCLYKLTIQCNLLIFLFSSSIFIVEARYSYL